MRKRRVNVITLGCSKNLVDTERLMHMMQSAGVDVVFEGNAEDHYDSVIINTCGFIGDAKQESIETILQWGEYKKDGILSELIVMGCLSQRYKDELRAEIPDVDAWFGKTDWSHIVDRFIGSHPGKSSFDRIITTPLHHAYVKISEGCNRFCAFCAIPLITGRHSSRPMDDIITEISKLVAKGVKEFNIIAQDLSSYGKDIYGTHKLPELIDEIAKVSGVEWIRLHYAYPSDFPMELLDVINSHDNICKYLDIALQHCSDSVLANMRRNIDGRGTRNLLSEIRRRVPGIHIRTTLMVGFPGEGDEEFEELLDFVREQRFERMGAFAYCEEDDTYAAIHFDDAISSEVKQNRLDRLMHLQESISLEINTKKIGSTIKAIIDSENEEFYIGRTEFDSPEVDPEVLIKKNQKLCRGQFVNVLITDALPFELIGEVRCDD